MIIGAGGGMDVLNALGHGATNVVGVEINRAIIDLVSGPFSKFAGHLYQDPRVEIVHSDGRNFAQGSKERYDLIQMTLVDSFTTISSGALTLSEDFLYTTEGFRAYLRALTENGVLALGRTLHERLSLVAMLDAAARAEGFDLRRHLIVAGNPNNSFGLVLLVQKSPFTAEQVAAAEASAPSRPGSGLRTRARGPSGQRDRGPARRPRSRSLRRRVLGARARHPSRDGRQAVLLSRFKMERGAGQAQRRQRRSARDSDRRGRLRRFLRSPPALPHRPRGAARQRPHLGVLLPHRLRIHGARDGAPCPARTVPRPSGARDHRGTVRAPTLDRDRQRPGAAPGSAATAAPGRAAWRLTGLLVAVAALALLSWRLQPWIVDSAMGWPFAARVAVAALLIGPLGLLLGAPMPLGLSALAKSEESLVLWAWGLNGAASVLGSILTVIAAHVLGFGFAFVLAAICYTAAAVCVNRRA